MIRCPYCGGLNSNIEVYCRHCGNGLKQQKGTQRTQPPVQYAPPPPASNSRGNPQARPMAVPIASPVNPETLPPLGRSRSKSQAAASQPFAPAPLEAPLMPPEAAEPEAPVPFPPKKPDQLQPLLQTALQYTVLDTSVTDGPRKTVRIVYPKGTSWQQVGTLYKVFLEQQEPRFTTIVLQGFLSQDGSHYAFDNGQLTFDRKVRLGGQQLNRYVIETGNGYEVTSVRLVLSEEAR